MSLSGNVLGITTYAKARERRKAYILPAATSNGVWMSQGQYSMRGGGGLSSTESVYRVFNGGWNNYCNRFNAGAYIDICLPKSTKIDGCDMTSSDGYFPATGEVYYSDDGTIYTKCGGWTDTSNSKGATAYVDEGTGEHRIWRFLSTSRSSAHPSSNADISEAKLFYMEAVEGDNSLPEGAGGLVHPFISYKEHGNFQVRKLTTFFTYKQDDKINIWEGSDSVPTINGITEAFITYRPHDGLDIQKIETYNLYRPHDGLDIRKLDLYFLYKQEDKVDTFQIPYGIGGKIHPFILLRVFALAGYLNDLSVDKVAGIAIENNYIPLKKIQSFYEIPFSNNNTTDT